MNTDDYMPHVAPGDRLWAPTEARIAGSGLTAFRNWVNPRYGLDARDYRALWQWSVAEPARFWEAVWRRYNIAPGETYSEVLSSGEMPGAKWFRGARVNFAEHLLRQGDLGPLSRAAVHAESESTAPRSIDWDNLRRDVVRLATYLRDAGVEPGDRVAAYLPMSVEAVVALLATASIGAVWSCCSPDFGAKGVLERFAQIEPKVIFAVGHYRYNGRAFDRTQELDDIVAALPSLRELVYLPWADATDPAPPHLAGTCRLVQWDDCLRATAASYSDFQFAVMPFDAPLWIMYSSGTTGIPKGIVHDHGGILLEFVKYAWLHDDMHPAAVKFFTTTTGWAMFNILLGGMMAGAAVAVYDGSPTWPGPGRLWALCERYRVNYFGASPSYVNALAQQGYSPREHHDLAAVDTIALTGSPSAPETFAWFYRHVHDDLHIISMSGGTDVCSAFIAGAAELPVHAGEIQCACLGVDVEVYDDGGNPLPPGEDGELVIRQPIPSMPLCFWGDADGSRYRDSYFADFPGTWRQGDLVRRTTNNGYVISGRSDSTLNRFGIRIGTAEIYRAVESLAEIEDSLVVSLELSGARFYMPLFVVLSEGAMLDDKLLGKIRDTLSAQCSPRHVPDEVHVIDAVPYTLTGKKLEVPVKKLLLGIGRDRAVNTGAVANPAAMDYFAAFADTVRAKEAGNA